MDVIKEFFGIDGFSRTPEGYFSWQHLTFVTALMILMVACAVLFGLRARRKSEKQKNTVLIVAALLIDGLELFKIFMAYYAGDARSILLNLPLFLCSIQLITIPLAAFSKGRLKQAALDFVFIFGILGAVMGTYFAGQNYGAYPVLSFPNVVSGLTHSISGFASLYIAISGLLSMKKRNIPITFAILLFFCTTAYIVNIVIDYNYMFLMRGDGTPYDIFYNLVGGHAVLYPAIVVLLFLLYISLFYWIYYLCCARRKKN